MTRGAMRLKEAFGDIQSCETWQRVLEGVDIVFHLAAQTSLNVAEEDPVADFNANVLPLLHLVETCRREGLCPAVIFAGTVTETGIPIRWPVDETHPDHPLTVYDLHKWMAEQYLKHYVGLGVIRGTVLRLANVYGPGPRSQSRDRGILNQTIAKALRGETLTIYGSGNQLRDYIYVEDAALAFLTAGANLERVNGKHFVIGTGEGHTLAETFHLVADEVRLITGRRVEIEHVEPPAPLTPIETRNFVADSRSFSELTGWIPSTSLREGMVQTIKARL